MDNFLKPYELKKIIYEEYTKIILNKLYENKKTDNEEGQRVFSVPRKTELPVNVVSKEEEKKIKVPTKAKAAPEEKTKKTEEESPEESDKKIKVPAKAKTSSAGESPEESDKKIKVPAKAKTSSEEEDKKATEETEEEESVDDILNSLEFRKKNFSLKNKNSKKTKKNHTSSADIKISLDFPKDGVAGKVNVITPGLIIRHKESGVDYQVSQLQTNKIIVTDPNGNTVPLSNYELENEYEIKE